MDPLPAENPVQPTNCANCGILFGGAPPRYCTSCGFPVGGSELEQQEFRRHLAFKEMRLSDLEESIKRARLGLYILAGSTILGAIVTVALAGLDEAVVVTLVLLNLFLAAVYLVLAYWTRSKPFIAVLIGAILFGVVAIANAIEEPESIIKGIIIKVIVIVFLVRGLSAASEAEKIKKELNVS